MRESSVDPQRPVPTMNRDMMPCAGVLLRRPPS